MDIEIKAHEHDRRFLPDPIVWRPPREYDGGTQKEEHRTCSYCGSINPEDLISMLESGKATLHGADWKYGWPHKFYIKYQNPIAGQDCRIGIRYLGGGQQQEIRGPASKLGHAKWYNKHLLDLSDEMFEKISRLLYQATNIKFLKDEKGIKYQAPHFDYQK